MYDELKGSSKSRGFRNVAEAQPYVVARTVRDQLDKPAFRRAMRSGYKIFSNGERFDELLDRLEESERSNVRPAVGCPVGGCFYTSNSVEKIIAPFGPASFFPILARACRSMAGAARSQ